MTNATYTISNLDCPSCATGLAASVTQVPGVATADVRYASNTLVVSGTFDEQVLRQRLEQLGHPIVDATAPVSVPPFWRYLLERPDARWFSGGAGLILLALALRAAGLTTVLVNGILVLALAWAAFPIAKDGLRALLRERRWTINLLMTVAAVGALALGDYLEAATVIVLFALGEALEGYSSLRARASLRALLDLAPPEALRLTNDERTERVPVTALHVGDLVLVQPGERVPLDGIVRRGASGVDQAPITGESVPVAKLPGDDIWAGSVVGDAALTVEVTRLSSDSTLSRIIKLVEEAQERRGRTESTIERFARWYTPLVMVLALLVAVLPPLLGWGSFSNTATTRGWLYRALALLVIACPCALVISAPVTLISGLTAAARRGVLIKGGRALEALAGLRAIAFDKTGTLTHGTPTVVGSRSLRCSGEPCPECDTVLALAAAVERGSAHPLARAITVAAEERQLPTLATAASVTSLAGRGVQGVVAGKLVTIGSHSLFDAEHPHDPQVCQLVAHAEAAGNTTMLLCDGDSVRGMISVADTVRPESQQAVAALHALGLRTVMLTGDNATVAQAIGREVGVDDVRANLLPADKLSAIDGLRQHYGAVAMVGDGINDTPALAAASVGIAIGGAGSAQAAETADVVLMAAHLQQLPLVVRLARRVQRLIKANIGLSLSTKAVVAVLAVLGMTSLWVAILADVGMTLLVTTNGMRPLWEKQP